MSTGDPTQIRDGLAAYARYLAQMDASMRQKVALTAAHLLGEGRVADMGMGSGAGSHALAALYPRLEVVGVDLDPTMVTLAREQHRLPNLRFEVGDIAQRVFADGSLDGIFDSSVLHHVTSFNGYGPERAAQAVEHQVRALKPHGVLVIRDFVDPGPEPVLLDLPTEDGEVGEDPRTCSSTALLRRFAREFRSLSPQRGFALSEVPGAPAGRQRFRLSHKLAAEFVLRKDYRSDWESEIQEEYTYFTQAQFEALFARLGLRVLASIPIRNPWIVRHRFEGKCALLSEAGTPLPFPATNYLIVGERVPAGEGVRFGPAAETAPLQFLELNAYRNLSTGKVVDLVRRPNLTVDVIPWFEEAGELFVVAKASYPRPILRAGRGEARLPCGSRPADYVAEPLNVLQTDKPLGQTVEEALEQRAGIAPGRLKTFEVGPRYFPSPGGVQEEVRSVFVEIEPLFVQREVPSTSGFSTSGRIRAIEACQLLRAAQVGGLPDARLELNAYALLRSRRRAVGPWIGEAVHAPELAGVAATAIASLLARPRRRAFARVPDGEGAGFLAVASRRFVEEDAKGGPVAVRELELVRPRPVSLNTVVAALLCRSGGRALLGVDDEDRPAAQCFDGHSNLIVAPAYRLPHEVDDLGAVQRVLRQRLAEEFGVQAAEVRELGGHYHPSAGTTPEAVYPMAVQVMRDGPGARKVLWVPLEELLDVPALLPDGHLRVVAFRAAHALGLLG
ncbi:MAG: methyltransferase domain-containing protein [Myxococcales bacterium]